MIGDGNRLAHAAALTVAELPAQAWNPLFIHGPPGLGKTHLLHAIGNYVRRYGDGLRVRYATIESFTSEFVQAVRARHTDAFRERFRDVDVLLLDDVQFLADKVRTKEELFHTFNALYEAGRQLVITSDRSPTDLEAFEDRLKERFECGLVAEVVPPDADVRLAILRKRVRQDGLGEVPDETLETVARDRRRKRPRPRGSADPRRRLRVAARQGHPRPSSPCRSSAALYRRGGTEVCSVERIQEATAAEFGLAREALLARDRTPARGVRAPGRHVPRAGAHRPGPSRPRARVRRPQPHHRPARLEARQRACGQADEKRETVHDIRRRLGASV